MKRSIASVCVVWFVAACLSGCSWFDRSGVVVSEDEFRITEDTFFATQLSPIAREMDTAPGINTSYLVTFDRDGSAQALKIEPMEIAVPVWQGDTLVAVDRKFDYFVSDRVVKVDHPKTEVTTFLYPSTTSDEVFALMNNGWREDGSSYHASTETITPQGYSTTDLDGIFLTGSECDGVLYALGDATGETAKHAPPELRDNATALVQASGTSDGKQRIVEMSQTHEAETSSEPLPCVNGRVVQLLNTEIVQKSKSGEPRYTYEAFVRIRDTKTGKHKDVPMKNADGSRFIYEDLQFLTNPYYEVDFRAGSSIRWLAREGSFWQTNIDTGVTEKLFQIQESEQFFAVGNAAFSPEGIHILAELEDGTVIKSFSKKDGSLTRTLEVPGFDTITARTRQHWTLAVSPNVP
ncbi:hypothetical protein QP572_05235 [Brevibacterium sp. UMB10442]|nr:hypothetical protein [Brevibacterium sp. UMB10442]